MIVHVTDKIGAALIALTPSAYTTLYRCSLSGSSSRPYKLSGKIGVSDIYLGRLRALRRHLERLD